MFSKFHLPKRRESSRRATSPIPAQAPADTPTRIASSGGRRPIDPPEPPRPRPRRHDDSFPLVRNHPGEDLTWVDDALNTDFTTNGRSRPPGFRLPPAPLAKKKSENRYKFSNPSHHVHENAPNTDHVHPPRLPRAQEVAPPDFSDAQMELEWNTLVRRLAGQRTAALPSDYSSIDEEMILRPDRTRTPSPPRDSDSLSTVSDDDGEDAPRVYNHGPTKYYFNQDVDTGSYFHSVKEQQKLRKAQRRAEEDAELARLQEECFKEYDEDEHDLYFNDVLEYPFAVPPKRYKVSEESRVQKHDERLKAEKSQAKQLLRTIAHIEQLNLETHNSHPIGRLDISVLPSSSDPALLPTIFHIIRQSLASPLLPPYLFPSLSRLHLTLSDLKILPRTRAFEWIEAWVLVLLDILSAAYDSLYYASRGYLNAAQKLQKIAVHVFIALPTHARIIMMRGGVYSAEGQMGRAQRDTKYMLRREEALKPVVTRWSEEGMELKIRARDVRRMVEKMYRTLMCEMGHPERKWARDVSRGRVSMLFDPLDPFKAYGTLI